MRITDAILGLLVLGIAVLLVVGVLIWLVVR